MTEEIIIDGVNVAGCEHHLSTGYCQLQMIFQGMVLKLPFGKHLECNLCDKDCYYKQLKRVEQENERLQSEIRQKKMTIMMNNDHYLTVDENNRKYKSALEEIKKITEQLYYNDLTENTNKKSLDEILDELHDILNKINEVLK
jgi:hypothetical protein